MNETILRLEAQIAGLIDQQDAALTAADATGCSAEDRARHLANFDALQAQVDTARASLSRAKTAATSRLELAAGRTQPATPAIVTGAHNPHPPTASRAAIPDRQHRPTSLRAFRGTSPQECQDRAYRAGLFAAATIYGHAGSREKYADMFGPNELNATTLSSTSNGGAAIFVPDVMDYAILELVQEFGVFRRLADAVQMSSETWTGPKWTGAMTAYFVAHGSAPTQSDPTWEPVSLTARDLAAMSKMTRQLNEDAIVSLGDKVAMAAAVAFAEKEDDCGFNGTGASTYGGINGLLNRVIESANSASLSTATGHATLSALTLNDFWTLIGKLPNYPGISPRFFCHKEVYAASMGPLQTAAGGVTAQDIANGGIPKFLSYPVEFVQKMPRAASVTTGVTGILFGDISMSSKFGDRRGRTFETGFVNDDFTKQLLTLLCTERFDILNHTIVDPRDSTAPGPMLGLKLG